MTKVVHCKKSQFDIYIGRKNGGFHYGNPFGFGNKTSKLTTTHFETREECIEACEKWLRKEDYLDVEPERRDWILKNLHLLEGKKIGCFCKPLACHGDIYVKLLEEEKQ